MAKFYSIAIMHDYAFVLHIEEKNKKFTILETEVLDFVQLQTYLKNKKKLCITVNQKFEYSTNLAVPLAIAKSNNIKNYLFYKIKGLYPDIDFLLNFKKLSKQNDEENITYNVEAVDEKVYLDALSFVNDFSNIKSATINKFALLSLANRCIDSNSYICVYTYATTVLVLAVEEKEVIFSRSTTIESKTHETMQMDMAENITQTLSYIGNQFREIDFKTLVLSGSIALDDVIPKHIMMFNSVNISILYPNTFIKNLNAEESQEYILSLGSVFVEKNNQFFPKIIKGIQQFNVVTKFFLLLSFLFLAGMAYFSFDESKKYDALVEKNEMLKHRYLYEFSHTKMLPKKELEKYEYTIYMTNKYLDKVPTDILIALKPLIILDKPSLFKYKVDAGKVTFEMEFEKKFTELVTLYKFEKEFNKELEEITKKVDIAKTTTVDYKQLIYRAQIKTKKNKSINTRERRRE